MSVLLAAQYLIASNTEKVPQMLLLPLLPLLPLLLVITLQVLRQGCRENTHVIKNTYFHQ